MVVCVPISTWRGSGVALGGLPWSLRRRPRRRGRFDQLHGYACYPSPLQINTYDADAIQGWFDRVL